MVPSNRDPEDEGLKANKTMTERRSQMKKATLLSTVLLACAAFTLAQETNASGTGSQGGASASAQTGTSTSSNSGTAADQGTTMSKNSVRGCLSGSSGAYMLTDGSGVMYQLKGDESDLRANVNKEIEVMGAPAASASASASNSPDTSTAGTTAGRNANDSGNSTSAAHANANAAKTLNVTSVHKLSDSCTTQTPQQ